eukprot:TRINITY_DN20866_c0_g1_i1.p1 TRINITY_DN20866_c0_g1~~TRINITY_DN20866_c0_g1_i1.p1  ORF type:complete len:178 (+),score=13.04 TRINITY_DN20866_c0_g1_i1:45-578(+)
MTCRFLAVALLVGGVTANCNWQDFTSVIQPGAWLEWSCYGLDGATDSSIYIDMQSMNSSFAAYQLYLPWSDDSAQSGCPCGSSCSGAPPCDGVATLDSHSGKLRVVGSYFGASGGKYLRTQMGLRVECQASLPCSMKFNTIIVCNGQSCSPSSGNFTGTGRVHSGKGVDPTTLMKPN